MKIYKPVEMVCPGVYGQRLTLYGKLRKLIQTLLCKEKKD